MKTIKWEIAKEEISKDDNSRNIVVPLRPVQLLDDQKSVIGLLFFVKAVQRYNNGFSVQHKDYFSGQYHLHENTTFPIHLDLQIACAFADFIKDQLSIMNKEISPLMCFFADIENEKKEQQRQEEDK